MRKSTPWSLNARITALCLPVVVLLTVLAALAAITASRNNSQIDTLLHKVANLRTDSQQLEVAMLNQETGIRGYAIDGTEASLAPYRDGVISEQQLIADLRLQAAGKPQIIGDIDAVQAAADEWHTNVAMPVIDAVQRGDQAGALGLINTSARDRFDNVRATTSTLLNDIIDIRNTVAVDVTGTGKLIVWSLVGSAIVVIVAGFVLAWLLQRMVTRPVASLASSVRRVAAGDYNAPVDISGPPEVAALGRDVDDMRRRIVADLRLVQSASNAVEHANAQLERQAADLQRSNQDLEQFAYVASHDLQEPLRKVASFCQLLQRRYAGQLDERADQYISFAVDGAHRMQRLINDLLAFSRIGRVTTAFTDVDLNTVMAAAVATNDDGLRRADGQVTYADLPTVTGEEALLQALFANLISNSVKFRDPERPVRVQISAVRDGDDWEIVCRDNGIGIQPEYADKVFVIFQRLHAKDAYPGTGIGLAVAKRIVEYHGGRIWIDTDITEGAAIRVALPAAARPVSPGPTPDPVEGATTPPATPEAARPQPTASPIEPSALDAGVE